MADDTNSDTLLHFKRRITDTDDNQEITLEQETSNALCTQQNLHDTVSLSKDDREIVDTVTPGRFVSGSVHNSLSKKVKWSPELDSERKKRLDKYVNRGETTGISENDLGFDNKEELKEISGNCTIVVQDNKSVLDVQINSFVQERTQGLDFSATSSVADENHRLMVKEKGYDGFSEENKFLKGPEVETQLVNLTDSEGSGEMLGDTINVVGFKGSDKSVRCSLKIEVIDDTALIESVPVSKSENGCRKEKGIGRFPKITEKNGKKSEKQEMDGKKEKQPRRRGRWVNKMPNCIAHNVETSNGSEKIGNGIKKLYSRKEMEAMRFVNVKEQRKKWYDVYCGLGPIVAKEYDDLPCSANQKHIRMNFEASALPGLLATRGRGNYLQ